MGLDREQVQAENAPSQSNIVLCPLPLLFSPCATSGVVMLKLHIQDDEGKTTVVPFVSECISIGRADDNTIQLNERNISRNHAALTQREAVVFVDDAGSSYGTRVNGVRIHGETKVRPGDTIQIGDYRVRFREELADTVAVGARETEILPVGAGKTLIPPQYQALLRASVGGLEGEHAITQAPVIIGSGEGSDWRIADASIAERHARVDFENGHFILTDLDSSTGVQVNGEPYKRIALSSGDDIRLGQVPVQLMVDVSSSAASWEADLVDEATHEELVRPSSRVGLLVLTAVLLLVAVGLALAYVLYFSRFSPDPAVAVAVGENQAPVASHVSEPASTAKGFAVPSSPEPDKRSGEELLSEARDLWAQGEHDEAMAVLREAAADPDTSDRARELQAVFESRRNLERMARLVRERKYVDALELAGEQRPPKDDSDRSRFDSLVEEAEQGRLGELESAAEHALDGGRLGVAEQLLEQMELIDDSAPQARSLKRKIERARKARDGGGSSPEPVGGGLDSASARTAEAEPEHIPVRARAKKPARRTRSAAKLPTTKPRAPAPEPAPAPAPSSSSGDDPAEMYRQARRKYNSGDPHGAAKLLIKVVRVKPNHAKAHKMLGLFYQTTGDRARAVKHYKRYLSLRPGASDEPQIRAALERLE
jgi:ABC transport system ATP-binding/permease protein